MKAQQPFKNTFGKKTTAAAAPAAKAPAQWQASIAKTAPTATRCGSVTIQAKINVGFGNALYLRGEGKGLSWEQGVPLKCVDSSTWTWTGTAEDKLKFKLLLNDSVWSQGEDLTAAPGEKVEVAPAF